MTTHKTPPVSRSGLKQKPIQGLSRREQFALKIYLTLAPPRGYHESCAVEAVALADQLIAELDKKDDNSGSN